VAKQSVAEPEHGKRVDTCSSGVKGAE